jgi:hypothetical protein
MSTLLRGLGDSGGGSDDRDGDDGGGGDGDGGGDDNDDGGGYDDDDDGGGGGGSRRIALFAGTKTERQDRSTTCWKKDDVGDAHGRAHALKGRCG